MTDQGQRDFNEEGDILVWEAAQERHQDGVVEFGEREAKMYGFVLVVGCALWGLGLLALRGSLGRGG